MLLADCGSALGSCGTLSQDQDRKDSYTTPRSAGSDIVTSQGLSAALESGHGEDTR